MDKSLGEDQPSPYESGMQAAEADQTSPSRGSSMGTATKRSKRGSDSWLRAEDGSWVPESELDPEHKPCRSRFILYPSQANFVVSRVGFVCFSELC